jgi:hypothetical protein
MGHGERTTDPLLALLREFYGRVGLPPGEPVVLLAGLWQIDHGQTVSSKLPQIKLVSDMIMKRRLNRSDRFVSPPSQFRY